VALGRREEEKEILARFRRGGKGTALLKKRGRKTDLLRASLIDKERGKRIHEVEGKAGAVTSEKKGKMLSQRGGGGKGLALHDERGKKWSLSGLYSKNRRGKKLLVQKEQGPRMHAIRPAKE